MASPNPLAYPLSALREQITALEAAVTLTLADPKEKPVHQLRTATRRIEAQLALLSYLGQMPANQKLARKANRALQRIRRAAGAVRDVDVHRDLLRTLAHREPAPEPSGSAKRDAKRAHRIDADAFGLRKTLKRRRRHEARRLVCLLRKQSGQLAPALEALLTALKPSEDLALSADRLAQAAQAWFAEQLASLAGSKRSSDDLHTVRKAAKTARYLTEASPANEITTRAFEDLQNVGGVWHDLLTLTDFAANELGRHAPLTGILRHQARTALAAYRNKLEQSAQC